MKKNEFLDRIRFQIFTARDIDIFIKTDLILIDDIKRILSTITTDFTEKKYAYSNFNPYIISVFEIIFNGETVQLIFTSNDLDLLLSKFTTNLSMIWWNGDKIHKTTVYQIGIANKTIIKMNSEEHNNNQEHLDKVMNKFPDYSYCDNLFDFLLQQKEVVLLEEIADENR